MEDSAAVFEEFRDTAEVMEEEGLLPNVQKEEMEQGGTGVKPRRFILQSTRIVDCSVMFACHMEFHQLPRCSRERWKHFYKAFQAFVFS